MPIYTIQQLSQFAVNAGFSVANVPIIVAIAMAESGGNSDAYNASDPYGGSYGILQINGSHIQSLGGNQIPLSCAKDAQCSFNFGFSLWQQQGFNPWSTYTNGAYKQYLNSGNGGISGVGSPVGSPVGVSGAAGGLGAVDFTPLINAFNTFTQSFAIPIGWLNAPSRIVKLIAGILCIGISIYLYVSPEVSDFAAKHIGEIAGV
jgi:Lysozyme like domain